MNLTYKFILYRFFNTILIHWVDFHWDLLVVSIAQVIHNALGLLPSISSTHSVSFWAPASALLLTCSSGISSQSLPWSLSSLLSALSSPLKTRRELWAVDITIGATAFLFPCQVALMLCLSDHFFCISLCSAWVIFHSISLSVIETWRCFDWMWTAMLYFHTAGASEGHYLHGIGTWEQSCCSRLFNGPSHFSQASSPSPMHPTGLNKNAATGWLSKALGTLCGNPSIFIWNCSRIWSAILQARG